MKATLIKSLRSGAKKPWLMDNQHYLYKRRGEYKKGKLLYLYRFVQIVRIHFLEFFPQHWYTVNFNCLQPKSCTLSARRTPRKVAWLELIIGNIWSYQIVEII
jgi:hypothetical protein